MNNTAIESEHWPDTVIKQDENARYLIDGDDFIDDGAIETLLKQPRPDPRRIRDIIQKARAIETLLPEETAALISVRDPDLWEEIFAAAADIKRAVYDNRIVTFAPLYVSNLCVNRCRYCGFRCDNQAIQRTTLDMEQIRRETEVLAGTLGHKRIIFVCGEHPATGADYIAESMRTIYGVKVPVRKGSGQIRRVNVNAAPMSVADYRTVREAGIGTYQVFQETYHHRTYRDAHPANTIKADFRWRLYALHRAMEAGIDDVAIGALFGLYDWRFEVMGMLAHARDLERVFGIGPHTVSVPRIEPAVNTTFGQNSAYRVSDEDFKKVIAVLRLSIPYAGLIITCREHPQMIRDVIPMCTQRDASSRIGIGAYSETAVAQQERKQQFILGDTRSLDEVIRELAGMGYITSFCTAGYRCGRTGKNIMTLLRTGKEGCFCKLNAILTFQEWLEDFASALTRAIGEEIIRKEIEEVKAKVPAFFTPRILETLLEYHAAIKNGQRDLYF
ncbi:MAG: [FeFe] hydrogenase H-cluster radical SAM maturase HydG [Candidatus Omnitrophica bacterium]|nr:[FeFe] hydrogenase H-cluster radical SAM maturase HydG [Candidatus Omnitrophota bacterium]